MAVRGRAASNCADWGWIDAGLMEEGYEGRGLVDWWDMSGGGGRAGVEQQAHAGGDGVGASAGRSLGRSSHGGVRGGCADVEGAGGASHDVGVAGFHVGMILRAVA